MVLFLSQKLPVYKSQLVFDPFVWFPLKPDDGAEDTAEQASPRRDSRRSSKRSSIPKVDHKQEDVVGEHYVCMHCCSGRYTSDTAMYTCIS